MNTNNKESSSGTGSAGPRKPETGSKESFDEAVSEYLAGEDALRDASKPDASKPDGGGRVEQPALQEEDSEGNPAKTDNE